MKTWIDGVALMVDTLARAGDAAGLATEVLGFTTLAWNGGRARQEWRAASRVIRPAQRNRPPVQTRIPLAQARTGIAALFKADLFREGVDGEAVEWACAAAARGRRHARSSS